MQRKTKAVLAGAGFLTLLGLWRASRAKAAPPTPEEVAAAGISLEILDAAGQPVPHNSPATVQEGQTYTLKMTVTNTSKKSGVGVGVNLGIQPSVSIGGTAILATPSSWSGVAFAAGQSLVFQSTFTPPIGSAGKSGSVGAGVYDPGWNKIAEATDSLTIQAAAVVYAAAAAIEIPASVVEGQTYTLKLTVTNKSTRSGVGVGVNLGIKASGSIGAEAILATPSSWSGVAFAAGETLVSQSTFTAPAGSGGKFAIVYADVYDPSNNLIVEAQNAFTILAAAVVYGATIGISL